jgi:tRNA threonylcarbamoyladenosine biosynthesis protein TsaB
LLCGDRVLAQRYEPMAKGQAERLMPLIEEVLAEDGLPLDALDAIAVGVGPGNFTGIRIGVAAARGLALALGIPAIGVTSFEAMRGPHSPTATARQLVSLEGPRDSYLLQLFDGAQAAGAPRAVPGPDAVDWDDLGMTEGTDILGFNADLLSEMYPPAYTADGPAWKVSVLPRSDLAATIGRIAATTLAAGGPSPRPAPLYVRPADAALARTGPHDPVAC